jgi:hypothetical protein
MKLYIVPSNHEKGKLQPIGYQSGNEDNPILSSTFFNEYSENSKKAIVLTAGIYKSFYEIGKRFKWDQTNFYWKINKAISKVNLNNEVCMIDDCQPCLIIVPKTRNNKRTKNSATFSITESLRLLNSTEVNELYFANFTYIKETFPKNDVEEILKVLLNPLIQIKLKTVIWEIDSRHINTFINILKIIERNIFRGHMSPPQIIGESYQIKNKIERYWYTK